MLLVLILLFLWRHIVCISRFSIRLPPYFLHAPFSRTLLLMHMRLFMWCTGAITGTHDSQRKRNLEHLLNFKSIDDFDLAPNEYICVVRVCHYSRALTSHFARTKIHTQKTHEFLSLSSLAFKLSILRCLTFELNRSHHSFRFDGVCQSARAKSRIFRNIEARSFVQMYYIVLILCD